MSSIEPPGRGREWAALAVLMSAYAALFALDYPPLSGIEDEVGFVNQALVWSRGAISVEGSGITEVMDLGTFYDRPTLLDSGLIGGRHLAMRHPGRSLLILPFLMTGGIRAIYASGLLIQLALTAIGALLLVRLRRSPVWAALLLFHPTLAIYSRTVMGDGAAGMGLLLAALATTARTGAGVGAGLAVGLAALMRYHAGLALPWVALSLRFPPRDDRPWRPALVCFLAGAGAGGLIVAYNLILYGTPLDPFSASRGQFAARFAPANAVFYTTALLVLWPGMLLAPLLDRSPIRWLARGVCGMYMVFFTFYYFHDKADRWAESLVVGLRLLQVALPVWIVSYCAVLDDWLAEPIRRRWGASSWRNLALAGCVVLLLATGFMFRRHQEHLLALRAIRSDVIAAVPARSLVVADGRLLKLFGIPMGLPSYRFRMLEFQGEAIDHSKELDPAREPWYLALPARGNTPLAPIPRALVDRYGLVPVPTGSPHLLLFTTEPGAGAGGAR